MQRIQTIQVGPDGVLKLPLGIQSANKLVRLTVEMIEPESPASREEWLRFIEETAGSITDPTFQRHPQGEFEQREGWT